MFKSTTTHTVGTSTRLDQIFPHGLPVNSFIDKGRCAIGGTYSEIMNRNRCSIIVVPNISILLSKQASHPEIDIVYGDISYQNIVSMFTSKRAGHKIMTTPEGMRRIVLAAEQAHRAEELKRGWFLLLDESHTFITELYREHILEPFKHFWSFDNKCIISATPYLFSDTRFGKLDYHQIRFTENLGTVNLVNASSVIGSLNYLLQHIDEYPGNVHIFYNSVTEIVAAIKRSVIEDCNIFCADDKDNKNLRKLGDLVKHFVAEPDNTYKKINFYTCKYFEGWDLYDTNATVVLVTDVYKPHTKVGVSTKGKQAIGRLRAKPCQIIHLTNHLHTKTMKPLETFREEYTFQAEYEIRQYNQRVQDYQERGLTLKEDNDIVKYADIDKQTKLATLNLMKLDQQINEAAGSEVYNHIGYVEQSWKDAYYNVALLYSDKKLETTTSVKRKSASKQLEEDYLELLTYKRNQQDATPIFYLGDTPEIQIKTRNPVAYKAFQYMDEATMIKLKYNMKKVQAAIIMKENTYAEAKLLKLLARTFVVGSKYSNRYIKSKLQEFYNQLEIRDENGKIRVATASQLGEAGRFEIRPDKIQGTREPAQLVVRAQFSLRMAA